MTGPANIEDHVLIARDGTRLPLRRWAPNPGKPWAAIAALHGFNDYSRAFADAAKQWARDGIVTYAIDQRGFGHAPHRGMWSGTDAMGADLGALMDAIRRDYPGLPVYALGDSMGGAVVMAHFAHKPADSAAGLILVAPAVWGRRYLGPVRSAALWLTAHSLPWFRVRPEGLDITPSDNIEMLRRLAADPLVIKSTRIDTAYGLVNLMDRALAAAGAIEVPTLILYGARDDIIPPAPVRDAVRALLRRPRNRAAVYADGYHMLLRDLHAKRVIDDIAAWMRKPSAPLPSGADKAVKAWLAGR